MNVKELNKIDVGGSIYAEKRNNKLIIKLDNKRYYTSLTDSIANRKLAKIRLNQIFLEKNNLVEKIISKDVYSIFENFILEHGTNKHKNTIYGYRYAFKKIIKSNFDFDIEKILTLTSLFIRDDEISNNSKNIILKNFQVFLNYLFEKNIINRKISLSKNYQLKTKNKEIKIYTDEELNKLDEYLKIENFEFGKMIKLMTYTGLRIGEVLNLTYKQFRNDKIFLENKVTSTQETIQINEQIRAILEGLPTRAKVFKWAPSSDSRLTKMLHNYLEKCNIERDKRSFHEFRKTYCYKLINAGVPIQVTQKLMRHSRVTTTINYYLYFGKSELIDAVNLLKFDVQNNDQQQNILNDLKNNKTPYNTINTNIYEKSVNSLNKVVGG